jgi:hypothetical protein
MLEILWLGVLAVAVFLGVAIGTAIVGEVVSVVKNRLVRKVDGWKRYMDDGWSRTIDQADSWGIEVPSEVYDVLYDSEPGTRPPWPIHAIWNWSRNRWFDKHPVSPEYLESLLDEARDACHPGRQRPVFVPWVD